MLSLPIRRVSSLTKMVRNLTILPPKYKEYLPNEEWISRNNNKIKFGITKEAGEQMGEIVFLEFNNNPGDFVAKNDDLAVIESVKSVQILNAPFDCVIIENNESLEECLECLNENPECEDNSWILNLEEIILIILSIFKE